MPNWRFRVAASRNYSAAAGRPSFLIQYKGDRAVPAVVIALTAATGKRLRFHSPNIFPVKSGQISMSQANGVALRFGEQFAAANFRGSGLRLAIGEETVGLERIIGGERCRKYFLNYLQGFPLSYHGSDIANLDRFTCAVHRSHAKVSPDDLARYLIEDREWKETDAKWVRDRVRAGLEILAVNRRF
jgi:hypothetical protein